MRDSRWRLLALLTIVVLLAPASADDVTTLAGKKVQGKLQSIDRDGIVLQHNGSLERLPGKQLLVVDLGNKIVSPRQGARYHEVELTDGSVIRCDKFLIKGKKVTLDLLSGPDGVPQPQLDLPLTAVFWMARGLDDPKRRDEWRKMLLTRSKRDLYVIRQSDGLNIVQGTVIEGNAQGNSIVFEQDTGTREKLLLSRATGGLVFSQPAPTTPPPPLLCRVLDVFGNTLLAQSVELSPSGVKVITINGARVAYSSLAAIAKLDYSQGNLAFLSDLQAQVDAPELPAEELRMNVKEPYLADKAPSNQPLKLNGVVYPKGLWIQPDTTLTYTLGGDYREFKAVLGLGESNKGDNAARVRVTIDGDGQVLFSDVIRRADKPKHLTLDVKKIKQLRILVDADAAAAAFNGSRAVIGLAQIQK